MKPLQRISSTSAPASVVLIRLAVGAVFLTEGIQKFLFPNDLGVGRFVKIGIPAPQVMAPFDGVFEIVCGALILLGSLTRLAAIPLIIDMLVAIASTKVPLLVAGDFERGASMRIESTTIFPHAMAFTASADPDEARIEGEITAKESRATRRVGLRGGCARRASRTGSPRHRRARARGRR